MIFLQFKSHQNISKNKHFSKQKKHQKIIFRMTTFSPSPSSSSSSLYICIYIYTASPSNVFPSKQLAPLQSGETHTSLVSSWRKIATFAPLQSGETHQGLVNLGCKIATGGHKCRRSWTRGSKISVHPGKQGCKRSA